VPEVYAIAQDLKQLEGGDNVYFLPSCVGYFVFSCSDYASPGSSDALLLHCRIRTSPSRHSCLSEEGAGRSSLLDRYPLWRGGSKSFCFQPSPTLRKLWYV